MTFAVLHFGRSTFRPGSGSSWLQLEETAKIAPWGDLRPQPHRLSCREPSSKRNNFRRRPRNS